MNAFPERLKHFRSKAGLTQKDLANLVGISQKQISDYEVGLSVPRQTTFNKLLTVLGISEADFLKAQFISFNKSNMSESELDNDLISLPVKNLSNGNSIQIRRSMLALHGHDGNLENLEVLIFYSNVLAPHINDGDIIIIDKSQKKFLDGKIYAIDKNQVLFLRLLSLDLNGQVILKTTTEMGDPEPQDFENIPIYGRVIYRKGFM